MKATARQEAPPVPFNPTEMSICTNCDLLVWPRRNPIAIDPPEPTCPWAGPLARYAGVCLRFEMLLRHELCPYCGEHAGAASDGDDESVACCHECKRVIEGAA